MLADALNATIFVVEVGDISEVDEASGKRHHLCFGREYLHCYRTESDEYTIMMVLSLHGLHYKRVIVDGAASWPAAQTPEFVRRLWAAACGTASGQRQPPLVSTA